MLPRGRPPILAPLISGFLPNLQWDSCRVWLAPPNESQTSGVLRVLIIAVLQEQHQRQFELYDPLPPPDVSPVQSEANCHRAVPNEYHVVSVLRRDLLLSALVQLAKLSSGVSQTFRARGNASLRNEQLLVRRLEWARTSYFIAWLSFSAWAAG